MLTLCETENQSEIIMRILLLCSLGYLTWVIPVDSGPECITRGQPYYGKPTTTLELSREAGWRSIVIAIMNYLPDSLVKPEIFVNYGEQKSDLSCEIKSRSREVVIFQGSRSFWKGWQLRRVSGILAYRIQGFADFKLAIIFEMPAWPGSNWFGVKFIEADKPLNGQLYRFMRSTDIAKRYPIQHPGTRYAFASASPKDTINATFEGYVVQAFMTPGSYSRLKVSIHKKPVIGKTNSGNTEVDYDNVLHLPEN